MAVSKPGRAFRITLGRRSSGRGWHDRPGSFQDDRCDFLDWTLTLAARGEP